MPITLDSRHPFHIRTRVDSLCLPSPFRSSSNPYRWSVIGRRAPLIRSPGSGRVTSGVVQIGCLSQVFVEGVGASRRHLEVRRDVVQRITNTEAGVILCQRDIWQQEYY